MTNIQRIKIVLEKMVELLRLGSSDDWANVIEKCNREIGISPTDTARRILSMYGGMGSLNDLVLHRNRQPLAKENDELDALRLELYQLCHEIS